MSVKALIKFYIGQCLRQVAKLFSHQVLATALLARHIESEDETLTIIRENKAETTS